MYSNLRDSHHSNDTINENKSHQDIDGVINRHTDISLGVDYDLSNFYRFSDYVILIEKLIGLGSQNPKLREKINTLMDEDTPRKHSTEKFKKNIDILKDYFILVKVIYIQHKEDKDALSCKISDFTVEIINRLIVEGYLDTMSK